MADNANSSPGPVPCNSNGRGSYNGTVNRYVHASGDAVALHKYHAVKRTGAADATTGLPVVAKAADADTPCGLVVGFEPNPATINTLYCPASTRMVILVADDPDLHFVAVGDDVGETLDALHAGENVTFEDSGFTPSTTNGTSQLRLDSSTSDTTNTLNVRLVKLVEEPSQNIADGDKYKKWVCRFNLHQESSTTGV